MSNVAHITSGELVDDMDHFFAPMPADIIDGLIGQYQSMLERIHGLAAAVRGEQFNGALHYFIEGNTRDQRYSMPSTVDGLFNVEGAVALLNASYWDRALKMTDVLDCMPQKRRDEWFEQISECKTPEFEENSVRATLERLMADRARFFAERVDGIFRVLSKSHVTNRPEGFSKRMIIPNAIDEWGNVEYSTAGYINDLRCVVAKFMGRDEPSWNSSMQIVAAASRHPGEWMPVDGGTLRIRVYNGVGTAHLEVHPEMAWRLNGVLASLYPAAIPSKFREKPKHKRKIKDFSLFDRPLPFTVIEVIAGSSEALEYSGNAWKQQARKIRNSRRFGYSSGKHASAEAGRVMEAIGGVPCDKGHSRYWQFDYDPQTVIDHIICSGRIPDHKSHQYYPTPDALAVTVIDMALVNATEGMAWLEPSAGIGNLADKVPTDLLQCIEISPLHCQILKAKGHSVIEADFLMWNPDRLYDRIVMNPPFSEGRWQAHIEHASDLLSDTGRLIAILPASAKGKAVLDEGRFTLEWSDIYKNEFAGTSIDVVIMTAY